MATEKGMGYGVIEPNEMDPWAVHTAASAGVVTGAMGAARDQYASPGAPPPPYSAADPWLDPSAMTEVMRATLPMLPNFGAEAAAVFASSISPSLQQVYTDGLTAGAQMVTNIATEKATEAMEGAAATVEEAKKDPKSFGRKALGATAGILSLLWEVTGGVVYDAINTAASAVICNVLRATLGANRPATEPTYDATQHLDPQALAQATERARDAHPTLWQEMQQAYERRSTRLETIRNACKDDPFQAMHMSTYGVTLTDLTMTSLAMDGGLGEKALGAAHKIDAGRAAMKAGVVGAIEHAFHAVGDLFKKVRHPATDHPPGASVSPSAARTSSSSLDKTP
jgi:hypothetical protein